MTSESSPPINALLECPSADQRAESRVYDALDCSSETDLLVVSYRTDPDEWFRRTQIDVSSRPADVGFVRVGDETRSAAAATASAPSPDPDRSPPIVDCVADPTDLAALGVRISRYLESWAETDRRTVLLFESLPALLDHVDRDRAFRFLHLLTGRVESVDGRGYYLFDPAAIDDPSAAPFRELVDSTVDPDALATS